MHVFFCQTVFRLLRAGATNPPHPAVSTTPKGSLNAACCKILLLFLLLCLASGSQAAKGEFTGTGEIIVISPQSMTVAVEVVLKGRPHIVGGRVAPDAILLRGDLKSDLDQFRVGEIVRIAWKVIEQRKQVVSLIVDEAEGKGAPDQRAAPSGTKETATAGGAGHRPEAAAQPLLPTTMMIGTARHHRIGPKETLLDIARHYNLGYNEIVDMYPEYDPWLPPVGRVLILPTTRLLPDADRKGIVINIPEMRLYYFSGKEKNAHVVSHPIGIGDVDFQTEPGRYIVGSKAIDPTWYIPPSLRSKYSVTSIPPGPDNPLGKYWLGLKGTNYGIHGSDIPWSIGRKVTHGCIRMYPEDIADFYPLVQPGTPVRIVYEPVKIAQIGEEVYIEVHSDIYAKIPDLADHARQMLIERDIWFEVDRQRFATAVRESRGIPVNITFGSRLQDGNGISTVDRPEPSAVAVFPEADNQ